MNRRIRLDDLQRSPYNELVHTLADQWGRLAPPASGLAYDDYTESIAILLLTTQSPERTRTITEAVLKQAISLHKSSEWIQQELRFEGMIEGADRSDFLRLDLSQSTAVDDATLDLYNQRVSRFSEQA